MDESQDFIEASLDVPSEITDAMCNFIIENITGGLLLEEEEDSVTTTVKFYVPENDDKNFRSKIDFYIKSLEELYPDKDIDIVLKEKTIQNVEWEDSYKESVKPIIIDKAICIRPPWEEENSQVEYDIEIEPKMAFGTGTHETTRGCLRAIKNNFKNGMSFVDIGCGSGVLSILADKMGASYIKAIDYDPISVSNTIENFEINKVTAENEVLHGSIEQCDSDKPYDFVCANIIKVTILSMIPRLVELTKQNGGILVLSGLLDIDEPDIIETLLKFRLNRYKILSENEWRTFIIKR